MYDKEMKTHLVRVQSKFPSVCTQCKDRIPPDQLFYREEGVKEHLHSLIARNFCMKCYARYGEGALLTGKVSSE